MAMTKQTDANTFCGQFVNFLPGVDYMYKLIYNMYRLYV